MANPRASGDRHDVFPSFRGADTRKLFSDYLYQKLVTDGTPASYYPYQKLVADGTRASGDGSNRCIRRGRSARKALLTESTAVEHPKRVDDAPAVPGHFKGRSHAAFYDFRGRDTLTGILGEHVYASDQFFRRSDAIKVLAKPVDNESSDIWFVAIEGGVNGFSKATFLRVAFSEFSTHFEVVSFLADIQESSQLNGLTHLLIRLVRKLAPYRDSATYRRGAWMTLIREIISSEKILVILDDAYQREQIKKLVQMSAGMLLEDRVLITVSLRATIRGKAILSTKSYIIVRKDMSKGPQDFLSLGVGEIDHDKHLQLGTVVTSLPQRPGIKKLMIFRGDLVGYIQNHMIHLRNLNLQSLFKKISNYGIFELRLLSWLYRPWKPSLLYITQGSAQQYSLIKGINLASSRVEYEVFLSFDSGLKVSDCLYKYMEKAGIRVFRSYKKLHKDEQIDEELSLAIKDSKICIPIFSGGYAWRESCLHELACMVESQRKSSGPEILPVFYDVEPSDVMLHSRLYNHALSHHRKKYPHEIVLKWEEALRKVAAIKGWESDDKEDTKLCKSLVRGVLNKLKVKHVKAHSVGMEDRVEAIMRLLDIESGDVLYVGIHGIGGIGKTTLAKVIFDQISCHFEECSFLSNVGESSRLKGLNYLQEQLYRDIPVNNNEMRPMRERFRDKKVLIVLDDVDQMEQVEELAGRPSWFASGSRIIITTNNINILVIGQENSDNEFNLKHPKFRAFDVKELDFDKALQLFCRHAFGTDFPSHHYQSLTKEIVSLIGGVPLALEIIGPFLNRKSQDFWVGFSERLKGKPHMEIKEILRIAYEALDYETQQVFLDIACFFVGTESTNPSYMWDACGICMSKEVEVLQFMSMVKVVESNKLWMHYLVKDMGRDIVREQGFMDLEKCTRLWVHEEVIDILKRKEGKLKIEALQSCCDDSLWDYTFTHEELGSLLNLRFLELFGGHFGGDLRWSLPRLIWLSWHFCPEKIEATNICFRNLRILDLSRSYITHQWGGWSQIMRANNLKVLNLTSCKNLITTPDFSGYGTLERLILEDCGNLVEIHGSIGKLKHLMHLNVKGCNSLKGLPDSIGSLSRLTEIVMKGKGQCFMVPDSIGDLSSLLTLQITDVETIIPRSIQKLEKLEHMSLGACSGDVKIPSSFGYPKLLVELDLSGASITMLPDSIGQMKKLKVIKLEFSLIQQLHASIGGLEKLEELNAKYCKDLQGAVPVEIGTLSNLRILDLSFTNIYSLPKTMDQLSLLQKLHLESCDRLDDLPELPKSLVSLKIKSRMLQKFPHLSGMERLRHLQLFYSNDKQSIRVLSFSSNRGRELSKLEYLELSILNINILPREFKTTPNLRRLHLAHLELDSILPHLSNLRKLAILELADCSIKGNHHRSLGIGELSTLEHLYVRNCNFRRINGLLAKRLRTLCIDESDLLDGLLDLSGLTNLTVLELKGCKQLTEIQGLGELNFLEDVVISHCNALESLCLSNSQGLELLKIDSCENLTSVEGLHKIKSLKHLQIYGCKALGSLQDKLNHKKRRRRLPIKI